MCLLIIFTCTSLEFVSKCVIHVGIKLVFACVLVMPCPLKSCLWSVQSISNLDKGTFVRELRRAAQVCPESYPQNFMLDHSMLEMCRKVMQMHDFSGSRTLEQKLQKPLRTASAGPNLLC